MPLQHLRLYATLFTLLLMPLGVDATWGCKDARPVPGKTTQGCLKTDGLDRSYRLHLPAGYRPAGESLPLLVVLHGGSGGPRMVENYSRFSGLADRSRGFIAVYPKGVDKHWNDGRPGVNPGVDDVAFLRRLVKHLKQDLSLAIDSRRIFLVGMSNGGLMALRVACEHPEWIAGVGVVAAPMSTQIAASCANSARPLIIAFIFGDQDSAFLPNGRQVNPVKPSQILGTHIGIGPTVERWATINRCSGGFNSETLDGDPDDGTRVVVKRFKGCRKPVVYFQVKNGGHRWPDAESGNGFMVTKMLKIGLASHDIDSAEVLWELFSQPRSTR